MKKLSKEAKQAIRWYLNAKIGHKKVKEVRKVMRNNWGDKVMQEIKEWSRP